METLNDYKQFFVENGEEVQAEVSRLLNELSHHKVPDMVAVANRIGEPNLSATETELLSKLVWLGLGCLGVAAMNGLLEQIEQKENE